MGPFLLWHILAAQCPFNSNHSRVRLVTEHRLGEICLHLLAGVFRSADSWFMVITHGSPSLLLLLQVIHVDGMSLVDLAYEESVVREKFLGVNGGLAQEHTRDDSGNLLAIHCLDGGINTVSDEVLSLFTLHLVKVGKVNLG